MKKRVILIILGVLVVVGGAFAGFYFFINQGKTEETEPEIAETKGEESRKETEAKEEAEEKAKEKTEEKKVQVKKVESEKNKAPRPTTTSGAGANCTLSFGKLMLINPNFTVSNNWIASRKAQLISVSKTYGIKEGNKNNGDNLLDKEAAVHLKSMVEAYEAYNSGHTMVTRSCFRSKGTTCGRLCAKTGTSDHHTGYTCDLIDTAYGNELDTAYYGKHKEWQWLRENSYKYGFIDRFPEAWAGGPMSKPANVNANGTTGLYETWHYRYVGVEAATEIATGKYNNGKYDSLEHYLKAKGWIINLVTPKCR